MVDIIGLVAIYMFEQLISPANFSVDQLLEKWFKPEVEFGDAVLEFR